MNARDLPPLHASAAALATVVRLGHLGPTVAERAAEKAAEDFDLRGKRVFDWLAAPIAHSSPRADALQAYAVACYSGNDDDIRRTEDELRDLFVTNEGDEYRRGVLEADDEGER